MTPQPKSVPRVGRLAILMMQKNEDRLLEAWLLYHIRLTNPENIYLYDNGSSSDLTVQILDKAEQWGVQVQRQYTQNKHFQIKNKIFIDQINLLISEQKYDIIFPLDCDEFIAIKLDDSETPRFDSNIILNELDLIKNNIGYFKTRGSYFNFPGETEKFFFYNEESVFFGTKEYIETLDVGYHTSTLRNNTKVIETNLVIMHFHYKRLQIAKVQAAEKLKGRLSEFSTETLKAYKGGGIHLINLFHVNLSEYYKLIDYRKNDIFLITDFKKVFLAVGLDFPTAIFSSEDRYISTRQTVSSTKTWHSVRAADQLSDDELLLIHKYAAGHSHVLVFSDTPLISFLLSNGVEVVTISGLHSDSVAQLLYMSTISQHSKFGKLTILDDDFGLQDFFGQPKISILTLASRAAENIGKGRHAEIPSVTIINGLFRGAAALSTISSKLSKSLIIFLNFWSTPQYHSILHFFDIVDTEGNAVVLRTAKHIDFDLLSKLRLQFLKCED